VVAVGVVQRPVARRARPHPHGDELAGQVVETALADLDAVNRLLVLGEGCIDLHAVGLDGQDAVAVGVVSGCSGARKCPARRLRIHHIRLTCLSKFGVHYNFKPCYLEESVTTHP